MIKQNSGQADVKCKHERTYFRNWEEHTIHWDELNDKEIAYLELGGKWSSISPFPCVKFKGFDMVYACKYYPEQVPPIRSAA